jgi:hypothetical protein
MGYVIKATGKPIVSLDIEIDIYEDGEKDTVTTHMVPGQEYEIIALNRVDNQLYTLRGRYLHFGSNVPNRLRADWIIIDCGNQEGHHRAKLCKIIVKDIKTIKLIETV